MIYILLGEGFEEIEAVAPMDIMRRAKLDARYVGIGGLTVTGAHGIRLCADLTVDELDKSAMEMIVIPGGMGGVEAIEASEKALEAVKYALDHDIFVGAICAGPTILGKRGWIDGKKATCYPNMEDQMGEADIQAGTRVVKDGKLITGQAPAAAVDFGLALTEALTDWSMKETIMYFMVY